MSAQIEHMQTLAFGMPGGGEMVILFIIVLLLFGAKKLPELARGIGKSTGEFKRARDEFEREITRAEVDAKETPKTANDEKPSADKSEK